LISKPVDQPGVQPANVVGLGRWIAAELAQFPVECLELGQLDRVDGKT